jgi:hypothetical protein
MPGEPGTLRPAGRRLHVGEDFLYVFKGARSAPHHVANDRYTKKLAQRGAAAASALGGRERKRPPDTDCAQAGSSALAPGGARRAAARA